MAGFSPSKDFSSCERKLITNSKTKNHNRLIQPKFLTVFASEPVSSRRWISCILARPKLRSRLLGEPQADLPIQRDNIKMHSAKLHVELNSSVFFIQPLRGSTRIPPSIPVFWARFCEIRISNYQNNWRILSLKLNFLILNLFWKYLDNFNITKKKLVDRQHMFAVAPVTERATVFVPQGSRKASADYLEFWFEFYGAPNANFTSLYLSPFLDFRVIS